jgi:hypothetical protein
MNLSNTPKQRTMQPSHVAHILYEGHLALGCSSIQTLHRTVQFELTGDKRPTLSQDFGLALFHCLR